MTTKAQELIEAYAALTPADRHQVAVEIIRRSSGDDVPLETFHELTDELFQQYDTEEAK